ncbi:MAG: nucleoid-associated protein [Phycisphaerae bacterium]|nr:MAG: YbaB/EbfC family nucleoid-associated protein [Planctomycetia bacterium]RIK70960.1 MAG: YbaB/EbfC family nucleoid-associated protein [Planctomycetota bacterium]GJQ25105.1 MAG: nucleoid-associated protein [Phycisphaerae bacterium]
MFGQLGNIAGMMKQAKELQGKMKEMQESIAASRYTADSGAGAVTATVTGKLELIDVKINPETAKSGDVEMLEDLVKSAVAAAQRKAAEGVRAEMAKLTGGLNLPGLDGLLGGA